jgi:hypothetical protein
MKFSNFLFPESKTPDTDFQVGPMSWEDNERSLRLFAEKVLPEFRTTVKI